MQEKQEMKQEKTRKWQSVVFLPGKSREQRSLAGYSLGSHKETDKT